MLEELPDFNWDMAAIKDRWYHSVKSTITLPGSYADVFRDRATYDPTTTAYVVYSVPSPQAAPATLTFGSSFMDLAATYNGTVVLGRYI